MQKIKEKTPLVIPLRVSSPNASTTKRVYSVGPYVILVTLFSFILTQEKVCDSPNRVVMEDDLHSSSFMARRTLTISIEFKVSQEKRSLVLQCMEL